MLDDVMVLYRYMGIGLSSKTVSVSRLPGKIAVFVLLFDVHLYNVKVGYCILNEL